MYPIKFSVEFKKHKYPGKLIALEGIDGSGKTTQAKLLVDNLNNSGKKAIYTKEPTDSEIGKLIRRILSEDLVVPPLSLQYLFCADRSIHQEEIEGYLKKGYVIVTDRYFWSAVAYGMADMHGKPDFYLAALSILSMYSQFLAPDYTIFLDLSPNIAHKRFMNSKDHSEIYDKKEKITKIDLAYKELIKRFKKEFILISSNKSIDEVSEDLLNLVNSKIK